MNDHAHEQRALEFQELIAMMNDKVLRSSYLASKAEAGDPWQDALAQAIQDRGIDI